MQKRGANLDELREAIVAIVTKNQKRLDELSDHALKRDRGLHIAGRGDWLLRYRIIDDTVVLWLLATGSHRDVLNIE